MPCEHERDAVRSRAHLGPGLAKSRGRTVGHTRTQCSGASGQSFRPRGVEGCCPGWRCSGCGPRGGSGEFGDKVGRRLGLCRGRLNERAMRTKSVLERADTPRRVRRRVSASRRYSMQDRTPSSAPRRSRLGPRPPHCPHQRPSKHFWSTMWCPSRATRASLAANGPGLACCGLCRFVRPSSSALRSSRCIDSTCLTMIRR